jgi:hypothetical protein
MMPVFSLVMGSMCLVAGAALLALPTSREDADPPRTKRDRELDRDAARFTGWLESRNHDAELRDTDVERRWQLNFQYINEGSFPIHDVHVRAKGSDGQWMSWAHYARLLPSADIDAERALPVLTAYELDADRSAARRRFDRNFDRFMRETLETLASRDVEIDFSDSRGNRWSRTSTGGLVLVRRAPAAR